MAFDTVEAESKNSTTLSNGNSRLTRHKASSLDFRRRNS